MEIEEAISRIEAVLTEFIKLIADDEDAVSVQITKAPRTYVFEVTLSVRDRKKILGTNGENIKGLRALLRQIRRTGRRRIRLVILDS